MMEHTVTVSAATSARDTGGGTGVTYSTRTAGVACLIQSPFDAAQSREGGEPLVGTYTVATFETGVQRGDSLTVTAGPSLVGAILRVTGIKSQPPVDMLGFTETLVHIQAERVR